MTEVMKQQWQRLTRRNVSDASRPAPWRGVLLLVVVAFVVTLTVVMTLWQGNNQYRPLYGEHEAFDSAQVITVLEEQGMDFYIEPQQGNVMVARSELGQARMALATAGVKPEVPTGLEILAQDASLGTSQFMENARYRHGLEGELAQSIMTLDAISNVRVHLAIPKQTLFVRRDKELASASVVVALLPGKTLSSSQVSAIVNLVSGSVTDLPADRVNVIDQHGNLLSSHEGQQHTGQANGAYLDYLARLEQTYIERAQKMLQPMLGMGNFQVEVAAKINFDRTEATEERYAPEGVLRSEFSSYDRRTAADAKGVPGALSNRPPEEGEEDDPNKANERGEASREYLIDRTMKHIKYQQGSLERLSVSVLLNGTPDTFTAAQLADMQTMLSNAMGISAERGDTISLNVFPFNIADNAEIAAEPEWWMQPIWLEYLRYLLSALVIVVLLLVVVRPVMRALSGDTRAARDNERLAVKKAKVNKTKAIPSTVPATSDTESTTTAVATAATTTVPATLTEGTRAVMDHESILAELPSPETGLEAQSAYLQMLSEKEPERVAHVVKQWITPKDADN
ncbi:flagellar M-ring protein FliF [Photobacterium aphoticum]|uniref:Flagellar M-ring protein n=1 Tax=Photobacterium aphoticum TaxID=754436 RepID=A0A090QVU4_9GAMM|nr:flagellar M-ring protein FliF [Photobacterium aphoticum]